MALIIGLALIPTSVIIYQMASNVWRGSTGDWTIAKLPQLLENEKLLFKTMPLNNIQLLTQCREHCSCEVQILLTSDVEKDPLKTYECKTSKTKEAKAQSWESFLLANNPDFVTKYTESLSCQIEMDLGQGISRCKTKWINKAEEHNAKEESEKKRIEDELTRREQFKADSERDADALDEMKSDEKQAEIKETADELQRAKAEKGRTTKKEGTGSIKIA